MSMPKQLCESCRTYKIIKKRQWDGVLLCKRCSKDKPLSLFKETKNV